jgi:hypothetical protein
MPYDILTQIQETETLDLKTLVREVNARIDILNRNAFRTVLKLSVLEELASTRKFSVFYRQNQIVEVTDTAIHVYLTDIVYHAPDGDMTVETAIRHADNPGVDVPIIFDPPLVNDQLLATSTSVDYKTLSKSQGGNAEMFVDDLLVVQTTNGTVGDILFITIHFYAVEIAGPEEQRRSDTRRRVIADRVFDANAALNPART